MGPLESSLKMRGYDVQKFDESHVIKLSVKTKMNGKDVIVSRTFSEKFIKEHGMAGNLDEINKKMNETVERMKALGSAYDIGGKTKSIILQKGKGRTSDGTVIKESDVSKALEKRVTDKTKKLVDAQAEKNDRRISKLENHIKKTQACAGAVLLKKEPEKGSTPTFSEGDETIKIAKEKTPDKTAKERAPDKIEKEKTPEEQEESFVLKDILKEEENAELVRDSKNVSDEIHDEDRPPLPSREDTSDEPPLPPLPSNEAPYVRPTPQWDANAPPLPSREEDASVPKAPPAPPPPTSQSVPKAPRPPTSNASEEPPVVTTEHGSKKAAHPLGKTPPKQGGFDVLGAMKGPLERRREVIDGERKIEGEEVADEDEEVQDDSWLDTDK